MGLNINTSDSEHLNQPEVDKTIMKPTGLDKALTEESIKFNKEYKGEARGRKEDGYTVDEKGCKIRKWVDADGNWQEERLK